jgi:ligand-binding sensor domain-containing protein/signal transduction histidine kinase
VFACLVQIAVPAQSQDKRFHHLTINEGLSQSTVQSIFQDSDGYMWFGTQDGLNKYDGYNFTVYKHEPNKPGSISDNNIITIFEDSANTLWFGTSTRGISRYDREKDRFTNYIGSPDDLETLSSNNVWDILEDSDGFFWVATGNGLNLMDRQSNAFRRIFSDRNDPATLSNNHVTVLFEDSDGTLWVGTADGFNKLDRDKGEFTRYQTFESVDGSTQLGMIRDIYEDQHGTLWIGTEEQGLLIFEPDTKSFTQYIHEPDNPESISGISVFSITEDHHSNLWIGTGNDGLNIFEREKEIFYRYQQSPDDPFSINNDGILQVYESREGIIWVGTFAGGINFHELSDVVFHHYQNEPQNPQSLSNNVVQSIFQVQNGDIWIGTDGGGLNIFDPVTESIRRIGSDPEDNSNPSSNVILDIHETAAGVWLATYGEGIDFYDPQTELFSTYRHDPANPQSLGGNYVFDIFESTDGHLWFSTNWDGVTEFDPQNNTFRRFQVNPEDEEDPESLLNNDARVVYEDSHGDIWIGAHDGFVHRLNRETGRFAFYNINDDGVFYGSVTQAIYEDRINRLWFGTRGAGLMYYDRDSDQILTYATTDRNLPSNVIHAIVEDEEGHLWLSTNNGISRYDPETEGFTNFNLEHGLNSREFTPRSSLIDENGYIYFGGTIGFHRFHPDSIRADTTTHPTVLTEFLLSNEPVAIGGNSPLENHISKTERVVLPYNTPVITIGYSALNFSANKQNEFAYILDGFDENWNYVGTQRRATYTNLSPGEYVFRVRSANHDGIWGEPSAPLIISITPPFWRTAWFIGLMMILIALIIFGIYRYRVKQIRLRNINLEKMVRERTEELRRANETKNKLFSIVGHDLRNFASSFVGFTNLLKESADEDRLDEMKEYASHLKEASVQFTDFLNNLLNWARAQTDKIQYNPESIKLKRIVDHVLMKSDTTAKRKKINVKTKVDPDLNVYADADLLSIVIYNLLNNSMKFSKEGSKIEIEASEIDEGYVKILVRDFGVGMSEETVQKLLQPDEFVSTRGTSGEKGTGLGFSLCKSFVQKNRGTIEIRSEIGKGTEVFITIPSKKVVETADEHKQ